MTPASSQLLGVVTFIYLFAALAYVAFHVFQRRFFGPAAAALTLAALVLHTGAILWRWLASYQLGYGHAPFSNLYESLIFFSWTVALLYLIVERRARTYAAGAFIVPLAFLGMVYAGLQPKEIQPLLPALKSNWLIAHVITCFLGYASFALSAGLAAMFLLLHLRPKAGRAGWLPQPAVLDRLIYQTIVFGFILLAAGIVTGSVWAQTAWGRYWSWDPKETWSLVTWLVYAVVLHARMVKGWSGTRVAVLSLVGFGCVLFTYFGVNLLLSGLHVYGR